MITRRLINIVLEEGTKDGILSVTDSAWNAGKLYLAPKEKLKTVLSMPDSKNFGVYILLSDSKVYVGKASELKRRIPNHIATKKWWTKVIILTTTNDTLNPNQITFLERKLIEISRECNTYDSDNGTGGDKYNANDPSIILAENYLKTALEVIDFIGIKVFVKDDKNKISYVNIVDKQVAVLTNKPAVLNYLENYGYKYKSNKVSYAPRSSSPDQYAIDVNIKLLREDWVVILNDVVNYELIHIVVPKSYIDRFGVDKLKIKNEKAKRIRINAKTLKDTTGFDFKKGEIRRIKYAE